MTTLIIARHGNTFEDGETPRRVGARTDLPLSEIAARCGFYDASDFGKRFREFEGVTPRGYRLRLRDLISGGT
jgi:transcriptional regulator GlxA family with amidase domain